jgi:hypothetical protein
VFDSISPIQIKTLENDRYEDMGTSNFGGLVSRIKD